ncbi:uncharacterized protein PHACADRAFT_258774 [Phanerochaete carnosa HHB-10118-sp]|uniref:Vacuolar sorting protein Vps3844 C-terminal domain-containing protein n=1 Tax=Phanerochaete carnosa (strain HHB-10118-sp) TaxID=650164 RepID=K5VT92_PHACS|nr:uncharacterized protein PHACADRAFT_258774 [Phanerochaete carnosa HHB-10118-sp]EKM54738.1 hypothetical protein PHACADRAFT_258774 [Phanerochaete carnosa HHB-10118-sp]
MRAANIALWAVCLISPAYAVTVYLHPPLAAPVPAELDARHASLVLAKHFGLEKFESVGSGAGLWNGVLQEQEAVVGSAPKDALLVTLSDEDARAILPFNMKPTFELPSPPMDTLYPLIQTYIHRAAELYTNVFPEFFSPSSQTRTRFLDIFSAPTEANRAFISSVSSLVDYLDAEPTSASGYANFAALELKGLKELAEEHGQDSEAYQIALKTLQAVFASAMERQDLTLAVLTFSPSSSLSKRADEPQSPLAPPVLPPSAPISAVSTCFQTSDACANSTDSCSGHGECAAATKLGRTCYICACAATVNEKGLTEEWAGEACERKDISGPFVLLGGTVIALILLVGGSIGLLTAVGSQELPSTLTGAVAGGHKRD